MGPWKGRISWWQEHVTKQVAYIMAARKQTVGGRRDQEQNMLFKGYAPSDLLLPTRPPLPEIPPPLRPVMYKFISG